MSESRSTCQRISWSLLKVWPILGLLLITACGSGDKTKDQQAAPPPPAVVVAPVLQKTVPIYAEYVARTEARETVEIRARVGGYLEKIFFKEGSKVKAGQPLFLIDQRPYKAALQDAQGQLAQTEATLWKAQKDVDRYRPLVAEDAAPQQDLDKAEAEAKVSTAAIVKAKAGIDQAELDLKFTEIRGPHYRDHRQTRSNGGESRQQRPDPPHHHVLLGPHAGGLQPQRE